MALNSDNLKSSANKNGDLSLNNNKMDKILLLKWVVSIAIPLLIVLMPDFAGMTPEIKIFLAITFWAVFCWATDILPNTIVAILLPVFYVLFKVAKPDVVFAGWTSTALWVALGGMIIAHVLMITGFAKRIAYWILLRTGVSFKGTIIGMMLAGMVISPFVPSIMGKIAIFVAIGIGICQALNLEPKSRAASAILLTAFLAVASPALAFLTGNGGIPMVMAMTEKITHNHISWIGFTYHNLPVLFIWTAISAAIIIIVLKPEKKLDSREVIANKYVEMGPISTNEKKIAIIMIVTLLALVTEPYHKINSAWVFLVLGGVCFLPSVNLMNDEQLGKINYKMLFFITGCMSLGAAASACGAGKWLAGLLFPYLTGSPLYTVLAVWFFGVLLNFILTPLAAMASFTVPLTEMSIKAGISPEAVIYSFLQGLDQYIFPYEFAVLLFVFSFGYISFKHMLKVVASKMVLNAVFIAAILYPYWKLIGLIK